MGISHELNTPLGNGLTASSYLIKQLENLIKECEFDREDNTALLGTLRKTLDLSVALFDNFRRSADLVNSFKSIASDKLSDFARRDKHEAFY